nr:hypothetical protein [Tanacetum cinerariifolium]
RVKYLEDKEEVIGDKSADDAPIKGRRSNEGEAAEVEIKRLKARVKLLEDKEGLVRERSRDDAPIKGRNLDEREAAAERVSDDTEEMATVLTSMDAANVLASGVVESPTGSGSIPTASPSAAEVLELLDKFQAQEVEINRLKERFKYLEDKEGVIGDKSRDDAPIKGRSTNEEEAPAEKISTDSEEIARVLTSMDAATVLAGETNVPTGSGSIPTAGPPATIVSTGSEVGPTASPIVRRRKGKEIMVESDTPKKKKASRTY